MQGEGLSHKSFFGNFEKIWAKYPLHCTTQKLPAPTLMAPLGRYSWLNAQVDNIPPTNPFTVSSN